jgi:hypothetical protein
VKLLQASTLSLSLSMGTALFLTTACAHAQVATAACVSIPPPALPVYAQPPIPAPGYLWNPGYWGWDGNVRGYYWIPGTWAMAPQPGYLWTPPYWGFGDGGYAFHEGYWGVHVGFYGGVSYGFGYGGVGYGGGYWQGGSFFYNRSVNNISGVNITNVYDKRVEVTNNTRASYNGGPGGVRATPSAEETAAAHETHLAATREQTRHVALANEQRGNFASANHGRPTIAATSRPGVFAGDGVVKGGGRADTTHEREPARNERAGKSFEGTPHRTEALHERTTPTNVHRDRHLTTVAPKRQERLAPRRESVPVRSERRATTHAAPPSHGASRASPEKRRK